MPLRHLILLLTCVIAAAGLTIFIAQGLLTSGQTIAAGLLIAGLMALRVLMARK